MFEDLIKGWDGEHVVIRYDSETRAWMFVAIHDTARGPAGGGTRLRAYPSPAEALADAMRLSAGMTLKNAVADLPIGGGKAVIAVPFLPQGEARRRLLLRYGDLLVALGGDFLTGPDMNTGSADMDVIHERAPYVFCRSESKGGFGSPSPSTAAGVFHGIRAGLAHATGSPDLDGRTVLVQGAGSVGGHVVALLAEAGAKVLVSDVEVTRVHALVRDTGAVEVDPSDVYDTDCDVFSPCAIGGILNAGTIPRLRCRVVAGSANNQLGATGDADRLQEAGIVYAPDFVISGGGVLRVGVEMLGWSEELLTRRLAGIGETLSGVFAEADRLGISTDAAAHRLARERLDRARRGA